MNPQQAKKLGRYLREQRDALGLSVRDLEARCGVSFGTIARIEQGAFSAPAPDKLARMAEALRLPLADVYATAGYGVPEELPAPRAYFRMKLRDMSARKADAIGREVEALLERHGVDLSQGPAPGEDEEGDTPNVRPKRKGGKR